MTLRTLLLLNFPKIMRMYVSLSRFKTDQNSLLCIQVLYFVSTDVNLRNMLNNAQISF